MATVSRKRAHIEKSLKEKYEALLELENGAPNKDMSFKYGVPKNTISTWKKNKFNFFEAFNNGSCIKKQCMKPETYEALNHSFFLWLCLNKASLKWLLLMRSNNIPINSVLLKASSKILFYFLILVRIL